MKSIYDFSLHLMVIIAITACGVLASTQKSSKEDHANTESVKIAMEKERIALGTSPILLLTITNITNHKIPLYGGNDRFRVHVSGSNEPAPTHLQRKLTGKLLPNDSIKTVRTGPEIAVAMSPGESRVMRFDLKQYYGFKQPGKYSVYLNVYSDLGKWLRTNAVQFEMLSPGK